MTRNYKNTALTAVATVVAFLLVFPIYSMFVGSFKPVTEIFNMTLIPDFSTLSLENYRLVMEKENFGLYIYNSFFVSGIITVTALLFHAMCGYALARLNFPGRQLFFAWIVSTLMIPFAVIMVPLFIMVNKMGLINNLWGVILPLIPHAAGIFLFRQFFLGIPKELEESAKIDGASCFGTFVRIVAPLSTPITVTLMVSFFLTNWNNYLWPMIVAQDRKIWLIQVAIASFRSGRAISWNLVMAASCIAALPIILLFFIFQRYIVEGIKTSGIKD